MWLDHLELGPKGAICKNRRLSLRWFEPNTCHPSLMSAERSPSSQGLPGMWDGTAAIPWWGPKLPVTADLGVGGDLKSGDQFLAIQRVQPR
jgi:hypothetical protein